MHPRRHAVSASTSGIVSGSHPRPHTLSCHPQLSPSTMCPWPCTLNHHPQPCTLSCAPSAITLTLGRARSAVALNCAPSVCSCCLGCCGHCWCMQGHWTKGSARRSTSVAWDAAVVVGVRWGTGPRASIGSVSKSAVGE